MASVEDLERRVEYLEEQVRHVLPAKLDALGYGLSLVHEDVRAIRETLGEHSSALAAHGEMLREILHRLSA